MEIRERSRGEALELEVSGRLDASWADHLASALETAVRGGAHRLRLDMSQVPYMSSVGVRVLVRFYKELARIKGSFAVVNPSEAVRSVIELSGLGVLFEAPAAGEASAPQPSAAAEGRRFEHAGARFEVYAIAADAQLDLRVVGDARRLDGCRFAAEDSRRLRFPAPAFGVGVGAFGGDFMECRGRYGEFLAAGGIVAYLPTDGSNVPDTLVSTASFVPELSVLYGLRCEGSFASLARFEPREGVRAVPVSSLAEAALEIAGSDLVGLVAVVESAGLVGAALRRSPAAGAEVGAPFAFPGVREWLSFAPERAHPRSLAIVVGVVARRAEPTLAPFLRGIGVGNEALAHLHAAAFSYRPLQKGEIDLNATVGALFEGETLQGVLHLLADDREAVGIGESELARGACWLAPIRSVVVEREEANSK